MVDSKIKLRRLKDKALIKKYGAVLNAEDVMRITGIASKATALKRMNCADEKTMLAKKGERAGYEYSQENKHRIRTDSLVQFTTKYRHQKWIEENRPFYDEMFRLVLKTV